ncbi:MAG: hypothetical protein FJX20_12665 [Alphaproteobacteria bacterium]|nr:hypothetical protein [Alphaproteobacteria bacterium]
MGKLVGAAICVATMSLMAVGFGHAETIKANPGNLKGVKQTPADAKTQKVNPGDIKGVKQTPADTKTQKVNPGDIKGIKQ